MPFCDCFGVCEGFEVGFSDGREGGGGSGVLGGRGGAGGEGFKVGKVEPVFTALVRTWMCSDVGSTIEMWMSFVERNCADGGMGLVIEDGAGVEGGGTQWNCETRCNVELVNIGVDAVTKRRGTKDIVDEFGLQSRCLTNGAHSLFSLACVGNETLCTHRPLSLQAATIIAATHPPDFHHRISSPPPTNRQTIQGSNN